MVSATRSLSGVQRVCGYLQLLKLAFQRPVSWRIVMLTLPGVCWELGAEITFFFFFFSFLPFSPCNCSLWL